MKWIKIIYVILLSFFIVLPLSARQIELKNIFPEKIEDQGWKAEEEPFITVDEDSLSMVINGAASRYFELGTIKAAFANYEKNQVFLMLEIYETESKKSVRNLFEEFKTDNSISMNNFGTESRFTSEMGGSYMMEFFQNKFYVRLSITKKSENSKKSILKCARNISDKISNHSK